MSGGFFSKGCIGAGFVQLVAISGVMAAGPEDLERLAEQAREAAREEVAPKGVVPKGEAGGEEAVVEEERAGLLVEVEPAKRAERLGLLAKVDEEAEGVFVMYDAARIWEAFLGSELGDKLAEKLEEEEGVDVRDPKSPAAMVGRIFGEEFMVVVGEGTPEQAANLVRLGEWDNRYQGVMLVDLLTMGLLDVEAMQGWSMQSWGRAAKDDPDFLVNLLAASEMPPGAAGGAGFRRCGAESGWGWGCRWGLGLR